MFLSGLWHGAAWTFVIWGLFHGLLLLLETQVGRRIRARLPDNAAVRACSWLWCFHLVALGWILFRAPDLDHFVAMIGSIAALFTGSAGPTPAQLAFVTATFAFLGLSALDRRAALVDKIWASPVLSVVFAAGLIVAMLLLGLPDGPRFIYFQF